MMQAKNVFVVVRLKDIQMGEPAMSITDMFGLFVFYLEYYALFKNGDHVRTVVIAVLNRHCFCTYKKRKSPLNALIVFPFVCLFEVEVFVVVVDGVFPYV